MTFLYWLVAVAAALAFMASLWFWLDVQDKRPRKAPEILTCGECFFRQLRHDNYLYRCANAESKCAGDVVKPRHLACEKGKAR